MPTIDFNACFSYRFSGISTGKLQIVKGAFNIYYREDKCNKFKKFLSNNLAHKNMESKIINLIVFQIPDYSDYCTCSFENGFSLKSK